MPEGVVEKEVADPKDSKEYTFTLDYTDGRGKVWGGDFTNKIMTARERALAGTLKAKFLGGAAAQSVDLMTDNLLSAITDLSISLVSKPSWAAKLEDIEDPEVLYAIYQEVLSHESRYFRREIDTSSSEAERKDATESN